MWTIHIQKYGPIYRYFPSSDIQQEPYHFIIYETTETSIKNFKTTYQYGIEVFLLVLNNRLLNHLFLLSRQHILFIAIIIIIRSMHLGNKQTHVTYFYESLCQNIYPTFASNNKNVFQ